METEQTTAPENPVADLEATSKIPGFKLNAKQINGIDKKTCMMVKLHASGKIPVNFLEVMACAGGCQNGPCSLVK